MFANKIEYIAGNTVFSYNDTTIKAFVQSTGAQIKGGDLIEITRHNGSDTLVINWRKITSITGKSGSLAIPATKALFYEMLFAEFFVAPAASLPTGAATEAKQDDIIALLETAATEAKQDDIILQNTDIIALLSGANRTTAPMAMNTDAAVVGTEYMLLTIRAIAAGRIVLKDFFSTIGGINTGYINLYKNADIVDDTLITYAALNGSSNLEIGSISAGSPTPQVITAGSFIWGTGAPVGGSNSQKINLILDLAAADVLVFAINPTAILTVASMIQTLYEV